MIKQLKINKMKKLLLCVSILVLAINNGFSQGLGDFVIDHVVYEVISFEDMTLRALGLDQSTNIPNVTIPGIIEYGGRTFSVTEADLTTNTMNIRTLSLSEGLLYLNLTRSLIQELQIPSTVINIGTISSNNTIRYLKIPQNVASIQKCSFFRIEYLDIEDGSSVLELYSDIAEGTFYSVPIDTLYLGRSCWNDSWVPNSDYSFNDCHIKEIVIGNEVKSIPRFVNSDIKLIVLPSNIEIMNTYSFSGCNYLETIIIEDSPDQIQSTNCSDFSYSTRSIIIYNPNIKNLYIGRDCKIKLSSFPLEKLTFGPGVTNFDSFYVNMNETIIDVFGENCFVKTCQLVPPEVSISFSNRTFLETPLYVPLGTKELYQRENIWKNFFNIYEFDWENPKCYISVFANPDNMGIVSGQGLFAVGDLITVNAFPNENCYFENWTENDSIVSTEDNYSFICDKPRCLVANFTTNSCFYSVSLIQTYYGLCFGEGMYPCGDSVSIQASALYGSTFLYWMEYKDGEYEIVSYDNPYTFRITEDKVFTAVCSGNGIEEVMSNNTIYPNPTNGVIIIEEQEIEKIEVFNITGQLIKKTKEIVIDLSDQEAGIYVIKVITPSETITKQIIKK